MTEGTGQAKRLEPKKVIMSSSSYFGEKGRRPEFIFSCEDRESRAKTPSYQFESHLHIQGSLKMEGVKQSMGYFKKKGNIRMRGRGKRTSL